MIANKRLGRFEELKEAVERAEAEGRLMKVKVPRDCFERGRCRVKADGEEVIINVKGTRLDDGDVLEADNGKLVLLELREEKVLEFELGDPIEAFKLGFTIGNYHMRVMLEGNRAYISAEIGEGFLMERFKGFGPKLKEMKFRPNVELPVNVVVDFAQP
mgnify:CR=1 FL=1